MNLLKNVKCIILLTFILASITQATSIFKVQAQTTLPTVYILPKQNSYPPGQNFNITVNVKDAELIHGWIFHLYWNPQILNCTKITEGPWTSQGGVYKTGFLYYINNTIGRAIVMNAIRGQYTVSGSGTLATITFQILQNGLTKLDLNNTVLTKRYFPSTQVEYITPIQEDGSFQNPKTQVKTQPEEIFAPSGENITLNITAANLFNLNRWSLNVTWNSQILNLTEAVEQPWNTTSPTTFTQIIDNQNGKLYINSTLQTGKGETGNRTLATLVFQVLKKGQTTISIEGAQLLDKDGAFHIITVEGSEFTSIPKLSTKPKTIIDKTLKPGSKITLNLTIENVENLNHVSLNLSWNPQVLNLDEVEEGPFMKTQGNTNFIHHISQEYGTVQVEISLPRGVGSNGTGVLSIFNFTVKLGERFKINITSTSLLDINGEEILHAVEGTFFDNRARDILVQSIQLSKETVSQKEVLTIRVTFLNNGTTIESFTYTIKFGRAIIDRGIVENLQPLESTVVEALFNIGELPPDIYEIKVSVQYLPEEESTLNNVGTTSVNVTGTQGFILPWEILAALTIIVIVVVAAIFAYSISKRKAAKAK
ncbi:MAG: cohesin domain-containing protein [Candidatus Bathyarchaeia archaeon]